MQPEPAPATPWPHAPPHLLGARGAYFVTCGTYLKQHHFRSSERLDWLHHTLLGEAQHFGWRLRAWAVFSNHYHLVAHPPEDAEDATSLRSFLATFHEKTAKWANKLDATPGRKVWHNYRDTHLNFQASYFARLNYTHQNAVKHGLVAVARDYPWCSAAWFERSAPPTQVRTVYSFKTDRVNVEDDYDLHPPP